MSYKIKVEFFDGTTMLTFRETVTVHNLKELYVFKLEEESELPQGFKELVCTWDGDPVSGLGCFYVLAERVEPNVPIPNNAIPYDKASHCPIRIIKFERE